MCSNTTCSCIALYAYFSSILKGPLTSVISPTSDSEETSRIHFDFKCKGELWKDQELAIYGLRNPKRPEEGRIHGKELPDATGTQGSCLEAQVAWCGSERGIRVFLSITDLVPCLNHVLFFSCLCLVKWDRKTCCLEMLTLESSRDSIYTMAKKEDQFPKHLSSLPFLQHIVPVSPRSFPQLFPKRKRLK